MQPRPRSQHLQENSGKMRPTGELARFEVYGNDVGVICAARRRQTGGE